ncbi:MAG TPA: sulfite exporter TauE/SafE family protein [Actinomycetes bacterium]|nr:sulfite exporter TauE/SafE family protein [Actinomycetes bacterium]
MWFFLAFAIAGGAAQLVDGTLGMGFGVTSATILLWMGVSAAAASAATHMAKLPTTFVSGLTHWRQGNVDKATLIRVAIPGGIAAFFGAVVLVNLSLESAKTWMAGLLLFFGAVILLRFGFNKRLIPAPKRGHSAWWLSPLGALGGFTDSMGGGGWGPVVTPSVMTVTNHEPRKVVGTVNAAEFFVAVCASVGFLTGADQIEENMPWFAVIGLIAGGVAVAPFAARLAGRLPHHVMGTLVGGLMLLVNGSAIGQALDIPSTYGIALCVLAVGLTVWVARHAYQFDRSERLRRLHADAEAPALEHLP